MQRQVEEVVVQETFKEVVVAAPEPVIQTVVAPPVTTATIQAPDPAVYQGGTVTVQGAAVMLDTQIVEGPAAAPDRRDTGPKSEVLTS